MEFGWKVVKHVRSNAIVYAGKDRTLESARAKCRAWTLAGGRLEPGKPASLSREALCAAMLFPFADGVITAAEAGATCVIQPGGSVRDEEVIAAADERGLAMAFTGVRHFRH